MIYITTFLFGPVVGGISGGIGSMLADVILGYVQFAPTTLIIKACEGAVVRFLGRRGYGKERRVTGGFSQFSWELLWGSYSRL